MYFIFYNYDILQQAGERNILPSAPGDEKVIFTTSGKSYPVNRAYIPTCASMRQSGFPGKLHSNPA